MLSIRHSIGKTPLLEHMANDSKSVAHFRCYAIAPPTGVYAPGRRGDLFFNRGNLESALTSYQIALAILERLAARDPANTEWQRDLSISYNKIGDVQRAQRDQQAALSSYQQSLQIAEKLAARDPAKPEWQR